MNTTKKGWIVVLAGTGINLAFGVLYAWSIFGGELQETLGWTKTQASLPYTVAIIMFAAMMIPAGRLQDRIGPKWVATIGGILIGLGCILAGSLTSLWGLVFSFGILAGSGIGLGYASTTPAAVKWFAPEKKGLITGIVVGGFGLASLYIVPLSKFLLHEYGVFPSFRILGILFLVITVPLAQLVNNPETPVVSTHPAHANKKSYDLTSKEMLKTKEFYLLWFMFFAGATGGLMTIGGLKTIVKEILGADAAFQLVAFAAIANALGRPAAGAISGRLGRGKTMTILYLLQATALFFFNSLSGFLPVFAAACMIYFAYGSMLSVFPSACGDNYGTKNLGLNYGIMFSAWGVGGIVGPMIGSKLADMTGDYTLAFTLAAGMLLVAAFIGFIYKPYVHKEA
ncbi:MULTISPECIES: OFA family MFS transporter [unclassified Fusibacter]|uniref:L-lactate MFS transporter n=1 Tax=unclassified Fusibacter TaxID=2624464 RepID=UPI0010122F1B|nr:MULTISPECIES: OFA family MFS transporter [unclassified Fusibacter]MCK8061160.1 OFA family MFS transporter [Fusibacter sp. A2]NPE23303.1 OFA family MFS transporter [Fusibacter sp. A1]RXV59345.1 MFS transporter [Fusibacter sp. A1]